MQYPKVRPIGNNLLIRRDERERQIGRIIIPDSAQKDADRGTVVAVGPGIVRDGRRVAPDVNVGDAVLFPRHMGTQVTIDGIEYTMMTEELVIAVIEPSKPALFDKIDPGDTPCTAFTPGWDDVTEEERTP